MLTIDHIGYAVKNMQKSIISFERLGYSFEPTVEDVDRNIYITFGSMNGYRVELIQPISKGSPIDQILAANGNTPYHICYKTDDFDNDLRNLQGQRFRITVEPAAAIAFNGKRVVFMYSLSVGLIELVES